MKDNNQHATESIKVTLVAYEAIKAEKERIWIDEKKKVTYGEVLGLYIERAELFEEVEDAVSKAPNLHKESGLKFLLLKINVILSEAKAL